MRLPPAYRSNPARQPAPRPVPRAAGSVALSCQAPGSGAQVGPKESDPTDDLPATSPQVQGLRLVVRENATAVSARCGRNT
jgi:hypothetical protein